MRIITSLFPPGPIQNPMFRAAGESGATRTVRPACKAFARGSDEKNGCYGKLFSFIKPIVKESFNAYSLPLTPYYGSRFNVLFHNSTVVYCLHPYLVEFLETNHGNGLTASVLHDLKQPFYVSQVRGFAILSHLYMAPLWRMLKDKTVYIMQMGKYYASLVSSVEAAARDPQLLLQATSPFPDNYLKKDEWWVAVFAPNKAYDAMTITSFGIIAWPFSSRNVSKITWQVECMRSCSQVTSGGSPSITSSASVCLGTLILYSAIAQTSPHSLPKPSLFMQ
jgi:hypothetical protein